MAAAKAAATLGNFVAAGAAGGFAGGLVSSGGDLKSAFIGGITGAMFGFVGASKFFGPVGEITAERVLAHGVVGGVSSRTRGGDFARGFLTSALIKSVAGKIDALFDGNPIGGAIASAVIGGTAAEISGGKFANGAMTAAFAYLFNQAAGRNARAEQLREERLARNYGVSMKDFGELLVYNAKRVLNVNLNGTYAYGPGASATVSTNLEGDRRYDVAYTKGVMVKHALSISAEVYETGKINGFYQSVEFCAVGCVNVRWNYADFAVGTAIGGNAGFAFKSGVTNVIH